MHSESVSLHGRMQPAIRDRILRNSSDSRLKLLATCEESAARLDRAVGVLATLTPARFPHLDHSFYEIASLASSVLRILREPLTRREGDQFPTLAEATETTRNLSRFLGYLSEWLEQLKSRNQV